MQSMKILDISESSSELSLAPHTVTISTTLTVENHAHTPSQFVERLTQVTAKLFQDHVIICDNNTVALSGTSVTIQVVNFEPNPEMLINWNIHDDSLGEAVSSSLHRNLSRLL